MACPALDCRGFLCEETWCCQVCAAEVCTICLEIKSSQDIGPHVCDPTAVRTAAAVRRDTRPCPSCGVRIIKVDGCDQMWCVSCHTAFSWRTGEIEAPTERVHNPEYFRWLRETGQDLPPAPQDDIGNVCLDDDLPSREELYDVLSAKNMWHKHVDNVNIFLLHCKFTSLRTARRSLRVSGPHRTENDPNRDLRVQYALGELSEEDWKKELMRREKRYDILQSKINLYEMLVFSGADLMKRVLDVTTWGGLMSILDEFDELRILYNDNCKKLCKRYGKNVVQMIPAQWELPEAAA